MNVPLTLVKLDFRMMKKLYLSILLPLCFINTAFAEGGYKIQVQCKGDSLPWMPDLGEAGDFATRENAIMATDEYLKRGGNKNLNCRMLAIYKRHSSGNYVFDKKITDIPSKERFAPLNEWLSKHRDSSLDTLTYLRGRCGGLFYFLATEYKKSSDEANLQYYIRVYDKYQLANSFYIQNHFWNYPNVKQIIEKARETSTALRDKYKRIYEERFSNGLSTESITRGSFEGDLNICLNVAGYPKTDDSPEVSEGQSALPSKYISPTISPKAAPVSDKATPISDRGQ
jgi:hypothetical protein